MVSTGFWTLGLEGTVDRMNACVLIYGTAAQRPTAAYDGRVYYATDTDALSYDNGSAWVEAGLVLRDVGTRGDIVYRGASTWGRLGAGTSGHFLRTQGTGGDPVWASSATSNVRKTAIEHVSSSTTLQDDDHLKLAMLASENWTGYIYIVTGGGSPGDIKLTLSVPSGGTGYWGIVAANETDGTGETTTLCRGFGTTLSIPLSGSGTADRMIVLWFGVVAGDAGDLQLEWAQNSSHSTATTIYAASWLVAFQG